MTDDQRNTTPIICNVYIVCYYVYMNKEQLQHRILSKTVKTPSCWFYTGAKNGGYGALVIDGKRIVAHRLMYEAVKGEVPSGLELDHLCGIKHCVNPEHLQPVTHLENTRRGPQYKGLDVNHKMPSRKKAHLLYIHDDRFREETHKSALVNRLLANHYDGKDLEPVIKHITNQPAAPDEGDDEYEDLVYDPIMNGVYDKSLQDYIDADIHMVKELKKRGQVR